MHFTGYILKTGLYVGNRSDVMEIMLYNGRRVLIFGKNGDSKGNFQPGNLIEFSCGHNQFGDIDLEAEQEQGTYYRLGDWACRIIDEETIRTFFLGAKILGASERLRNKIRRTARIFKSFFLRKIFRRNSLGARVG